MALGINLKRWLKEVAFIGVCFICTRILAILIVIYIVKPVFLLSSDITRFITLFEYQDLVNFLKYVDIVWAILFTLIFVLTFWIRFVFLQPGISIFLTLNLKVLQVPFREIILKFDKLYTFFVSWWIYSLGLLAIIVYETVVYKLPLYVAIVPAIIVIAAVWLLAVIVRQKINTILLYNTYDEKA